MKIRLKFFIVSALFIVSGCGFSAASPPPERASDSGPAPSAAAAVVLRPSVSPPLPDPEPEVTAAAPDGESEEPAPVITRDVILAFGGDVNLTDDGYVMPVLKASANGLPDVLTNGLLEKMRAADIMLVNVEFAFTARGSALFGKEYVFRSNPNNVGILSDMGVNVVQLANNHVFDYGPEGLSDTLKTLGGAGIAYTGAGENLAEASAPAYFDVGGRKIALIAASCIERYTVFTPGATEDSPGIFRADETNALPLLSVIREAASACDFVAVCVHWGLESTATTESYQRELGRMCVEAGADAVIGNHPHVLQGTEFHEGKPIVYSTGNFWFSRTQTYSCLLEIVLSEEGAAVRLVPCLTGGGITALADGEAALRILKYYEDISFGVAIDDGGVIREKSRDSESVGY